MKRYKITSCVSNLKSRESFASIIIRLELSSEVVEFRLNFSFKFDIYKKMREIVHLQAGQCGNQIGAKVSKN